MYEAITGYGLGGSSIALFGLVGGGIYTKAADVGADLVGKVRTGREVPGQCMRNALEGLMHARTRIVYQTRHLYCSGWTPAPARSARCILPLTLHEEVREHYLAGTFEVPPCVKHPRASQDTRHVKARVHMLI